MSTDHASQEREPGAMAALGCLLATVGLVAALLTLYTVHMGIPRALDCPPVGPPDDPGPGLPAPTTLLVDFMYVLAYTCVFVSGFWVPWSLLGRRRLIGILAGCLIAPVALLSVAALDLAVHVAPGNGLHFHVTLPDHIRLSSGPCPRH